MPLLKSITAKRAVKVLNDALVRDRAAINALVNNRVPIQQESFAGGLDHPNCPVQCGDDTVGMLGVINGLFGTNRSGWGCIAAEYEMNTDGTPVMPLSIVKFVILQDPNAKKHPIKRRPIHRVSNGY